MGALLRRFTAGFILTAVLATAASGMALAGQTPSTQGCTSTGTPVAGMNHRMMVDATPAVGMHHGSPIAGMHQGEFDLMYIDMMIPHHESVIALAEVARHELTHPELIEIAEAIVATQDAEIEEMELLRDEWYPDAAPVTMQAMMGMPGMGTDMEMMDQQMNATWQVETFCAADNKDVAFIEQVIQHHQMAIDVSRAAEDHAVHPELQAIALRVIEDQQHEIDRLDAIRAELTEAATPTV